MTDEILNRVKVSLPDISEPDENLLKELIQRANDRVSLYVGDDPEELSTKLYSIVVDMSVKMYRRLYFEGISSENADTLSTSFVENLLSEYIDELDAYINNQRGAYQKRTVRFL